LSEVGVDDGGAETPEFCLNLEESLHHEAMDKSMYAQVVHVRRRRANPSPKVGNGEISWALRRISFVYHPALDQILEDEKCLRG
jgi:hypothetical protein